MTGMDWILIVGALIIAGLLAALFAQRNHPPVAVTPYDDTRAQRDHQRLMQADGVLHAHPQGPAMRECDQVAFPSDGGVVRIRSRQVDPGWTYNQPAIPAQQAPAPAALPAPQQPGTPMQVFNGPVTNYYRDPNLPGPGPAA